MKKFILIILLSFILSQKNKCKPNEIYNEEKKSCVEICKNDEYFNNVTSTCEKCDEGEKYNQDKKKCEEVKKPEDKCKPNEVWNAKIKRCVKKQIKCRNGKIVDGKCVCQYGYQLKGGECKKIIKRCRPGYVLIGNKCVKKRNINW